MKIKILKILAFITAMALICVFLVFADGLIGNPVSRFLVTRNAKKYLSETYPGTDYRIEKVSYDFKSGGYDARIVSDTSADSNFNLHYDRLGRLKYDTYEDYVANKLNVHRRLETEYSDLIKKVYSSPLFPYDCDICYGSLSIYPKTMIELGDENVIPKYSMPAEALVLDRVYDIRELGEKYGKLTVYVNSDTITVERAAEVMIGIKKVFVEAGVPFRAMDFTLQYPKDTGKDWTDGWVYVSDFLIEDIYEEGMTDRVQAAFEKLQANYDSQDAKK